MRIGRLTYWAYDGHGLPLGERLLCVAYYYCCLECYLGLFSNFSISFLQCWMKSLLQLFVYCASSIICRMCTTTINTSDTVVIFFSSFIPLSSLINFKPLHLTHLMVCNKSFWYDQTFGILAHWGISFLICGTSNKQNFCIQTVCKNDHQHFTVSV